MSLRPHMRGHFSEAFSYNANTRPKATKYSKIPLLRPPKSKDILSIKKPFLLSLIYPFLHFLHPVDLRLETTFGTVQKWSLRPLLDSPKGGLNIGILLY